MSRMLNNTAVTVDALPPHPSILYKTALIYHLLSGQKEVKSPAVTTALPMTITPEPTTTTTPEPTTTTLATTTTTTTPPPPPTTTKPRAAVHKVRDAGDLNNHPHHFCI